MTTRKITVELTEAQYRALGGAVAQAENDWNIELDDYSSPQLRGQVQSVNTAWSKINRAWHAKGRS